MRDSTGFCHHGSLCACGGDLAQIRHDCAAWVIQHPDDAAIDAFADAMKKKMADSRAKGRAGWDDPGTCTTEDLSIMLRVHVDKGDPIDVANFCMMLWNRGASIERVMAPPSSPWALAELQARIDQQMADEKIAAWRREKEDRRAEGRETSGRRRSDQPTGPDSPEH